MVTGNPLGWDHLLRNDVHLFVELRELGSLRLHRNAVCANQYLLTAFVLKVASKAFIAAKRVVLGVEVMDRGVPLVAVLDVG